MAMPDDSDLSTAPVPARRGGRPRGRFAISPTGELHLGNARTCLVTWLSIRSAGGTLIWRLEDLDTTRSRADLAKRAAEELRWLGLDWDEGGGRGGDLGPYEQSARTERYENALRRLHPKGLLFPCSKTRKELASIATAPHGDEGEAPYPIQFRPSVLAADWFSRLEDPSTAEQQAIRFRVEDEIKTFEDLCFGPISENVRDSVGDFVLKRRDGLFAYQLAVVVDDSEMQIDEVVRGADLLPSTARQIMLFEALGEKPPVYGHVPLVLNANGDKLSKRDAVTSLYHLKESGIHPEQLIGYLAWTLGLQKEARAATPDEVLGTFDWGRIAQQPYALPHDLEGLIRRVH